MTDEQLFKTLKLINNTVKSHNKGPINYNKTSEVPMKLLLRLKIFYALIING